MNAPRRFCSFVLDGLLFGIEVEHVQEVLRGQPIARLPLAPPVVRGLVNLRGVIVTAVDLRVRLGLAPRPSAEPPVHVVVRHGETLVSLLVDAIGDVLAVPDDSWESAPDTLQAAMRDLVPGAFKLEPRLLLKLDLDRALAAA